MKQRHRKHRRGTREGLTLAAKNAQAGGAGGTYETLLGYSLGEIPRGVAMEELGLDHYRELLALLGGAALPMPMVPAATRAEMVSDFIAVLTEAAVLPSSGKTRSPSRPAAAQGTSSSVLQPSVDTD